MRSPIVAMLWENWRLTRVEAAWRMSLGIVGGAVALILFRWRRDHCVLDPDGDARHGLAVDCETQRRQVPGRVQTRLSVLSTLCASCPDGLVRRRRHGLRRDLLRWRCTSYPRLCWGSPSVSRCRCSLWPRGSWPAIFVTPASNGRPPTESASMSDRLSRSCRCSFCSGIVWRRHCRWSSRSSRTHCCS